MCDRHRESINRFVMPVCFWEQRSQGCPQRGGGKGISQERVQEGSQGIGWKQNIFQVHREYAGSQLVLLYFKTHNASCPQHNMAWKNSAL